MAYGKGGTRKMQKRMLGLGTLAATPDMLALRLKCLAALREFADAAWAVDLVDPSPSGKDLDAIMLPVQSRLSRGGLNNVWAEKMRLQAKAAVAEQRKRGRANLFGRLKNVAKSIDFEVKGKRSEPDTTVSVLVNVPAEFRERLSEHDLAALQGLADPVDFPAALALFAELRDGNAGLPKLHADALRAMADIARMRFGVPEWGEAEGSVQLHLDFRCLRGGKVALAAAVAGLGAGLADKRPTSADLELAGVAARGAPIPVPFRLVRPVLEKADQPGQPSRLTSLVVEIGPERCEAKAVVVRPKSVPLVVGNACVVAEDFGYRVTSSLVVLRSRSPISQGAVDRAKAISEMGTEDGKRATLEFLSSHVSGDEVELVESVSFCGRDFLDRIMHHARTVDTLRSEIDLAYNRLARIRREMNRALGAPVEAVVPEAVPDDLPSGAAGERWRAMHGRFFRLLGGIAKLKAKRRAVYRAVDGLKRSWFGWVTSRKAELAARHGAAVVSEDLTVLAVEKVDPSYKGRTFNRMINNGSKGQYILRSDEKLAWRGIASLKLPSYHTSTTDWRNGTVDKGQRSGATFRASSDGRTWDADLHASETLGRWLFLRPRAGNDDARAAAQAA